MLGTMFLSGAAVAHDEIEETASMRGHLPLHNRHESSAHRLGTLDRRKVLFVVGAARFVPISRAPVSSAHRRLANIAALAHGVVLLRSSGNNGKWLRRNIPSDWQRAVATAQGSFAASLISIFVRCEASNS